jgi:hypothetical protein
MARDIGVIWLSEKQKYFFRQGWTGQKDKQLLICPSG